MSTPDQALQDRNMSVFRDDDDEQPEALSVTFHRAAPRNVQAAMPFVFAEAMRHATSNEHGERIMLAAIGAQDPSYFEVDHNGRPNPEDIRDAVNYVMEDSNG